MSHRAPQLDQRTIAALAHPLRFRVLVALDDRVASPVELSREFGEPLNRLSHHVRVLARLGAIELVRTRQRRGAREHFYRAAIKPWFDEAAWMRLPVSSRRALMSDTLETIVGGIAAAASGDGFDHPLAYVSYLDLELDEQGLAEVSAILNDATERVLDAQAAAEQRRPDRRPTRLALLHFARQPS